MLKLKENPEVVVVDSLWENIFSWGYLKPEYFLDEESSLVVNNAIKVMYEFVDLIDANELIEQI